MKAMTITTSIIKNSILIKWSKQNFSPEDKLSNDLLENQEILTCFRTWNVKNDKATCSDGFNPIQE